MIEESSFVGPSTTFSCSSINSSSEFLQINADRVFVWLFFVSLHTCSVNWIVLIGQTQIWIKHHFFVTIVLALINESPLIFLWIVTNRQFRTPTSGKHVNEIIIVEFTITFFACPSTCVSWILTLCLTKSVCSLNCRGELPIISITSVSKYVRYEEIIYMFTTFLGIWHQVMIPVTFLNGGPTKLELVSKVSCQSVTCPSIFFGVASGCSSHHSLSSNNNEIC